MVVIGLDLETTALEASQGEIIEVAAIRFDWETKQELGRFTALLQPHQTLSPLISSITGITPDMLVDKPFFTDVKEKLREFIGADTVFAHNASFDVGWLAYHGLELANPVWDTFKLAAAAWPSAPSYNLGTLTRSFGITLDTEHRATADVLLTWELLKRLPLALHARQEVVHKISHVLTASKLAHYASLFSVSDEPTTTPQLKKKSDEAPEPIYNSVETILGASGTLVDQLPGFETRSAQVTMADTIMKTMEQQEKALIEADTGTGKTFAYLVPALLKSKTETVIISTHTRALQDQLIQHDIPALLQALKLRRHVAVLKGRRNYLCDRRLTQALQRKSYTTEEAWVLIKIALWHEHTTTNDLEELNVSHQGEQVLSSVHADGVLCRVACGKSATCPYQQAKRAAAGADIIIVNHALLCQSPQLLAGRGVHCIVDEAHHLAESARQAYRIDLSAARLRDSASAAASASKTPRIKELAAEVLHEYQELLASMAPLVEEKTRTGRLRLTTAVRNNSKWHKIIKTGRDCTARLHLLAGLLRGKEEQLTIDKQDYLKEAALELETFGTDLVRFLEGQPDRVQWLSLSKLSRFSDEKTVKLFDVPLSAATSIQGLLAKLKSCVFTSATLTTAGNFAYVKSSLGVPEATELRLPTVIDYQQQMLLYIVEDSPDPKSSSFDMAAATTIERLAQFFEGKTLALLTSHRSVGILYKLLNNRLYTQQIKLLAQGLTGGRHVIVEKFKKTDSASVLLGTSSFWEGLDVPGPALSAVVIPKLPFALPDDPIMAAVGDAENVDVFRALSIPHMTLRLRQGIGRLLRSPHDRGVVVLLDSRFLSADYRNQVLNSLPPAHISIGRAENLIETVTEWTKKTAAKQKRIKK